jgi:hypothetical protein
MMSNLITFEPHGSRAPKLDNKVFLYEGHVWSTSKVMQEHRQHIKRANAEAKGQLDKPAKFLKNTLKLLRILK